MGKLTDTITDNKTKNKATEYMQQKQQWSYEHKHNTKPNEHTVQPETHKTNRLLM